MDALTVAWLAGLYEGEGSLIKSGRGWALSITMTDKDVVEHAWKASGVGTLTFVKKREGWSDQWRWRVMARDQIFVVASGIAPFLGERRSARIADFLSWYAAQPPVPEYVKQPIALARPGECRNGHAKEGKGPCKACNRERQARYRERWTAC